MIENILFILSGSCIVPRSLSKLILFPTEFFGINLNIFQFSMLHISSGSISHYLISFFTTIDCHNSVIHIFVPRNNLSNIINFVFNGSLVKDWEIAVTQTYYFWSCVLALSQGEIWFSLHILFHIIFKQQHQIVHLVADKDNKLKRNMTCE